MHSLPGPYVFSNGLARRAGVARATVLRQVAAGVIAPDIVVIVGEAETPAFHIGKAVDVVRNARLPRSVHRTASASTSDVIA